MGILTLFFLVVWMMMNGFTWAYENSRLVDEDIVFKAHESSVVQIPMSDPVDELTICFWLRLDPMPWPAGSLVFLNYSTHEKYNEVILEYEMTAIQFTVGTNTILRSSSLLRLDDSKWKFICVQWENGNGMTSLYINGNMVANETNKQKNYEVTNGDDVRLELGYSTAKVLSGRMTCVNLWDDVLSSQTILRLYHAQDCGRHMDDLILDWENICTRLRDTGSPLVVTPSELRNDQVIATTTCTKPQLLHGQLFPETVLIGHVISTREVVSELQCQDQCLRAQTCDGYNIEQAATAIKKTCQLISGVTGKIPDNFSSYGRMFDRNSMHKVLLAPCSKTKEETVSTIPRNNH